MALHRTRVVIDPRADLIERVVFDVDFGGLSLLRLTSELVRIDQGLAAGVFDPRAYVTEEIPLRRPEAASER